MAYQVQFLRELKAHGFLEIVMRQDVKRNFTISYHNIFEYPLTDEELSFWQPGSVLEGKFVKTVQIEKKEGHFFVKGKERLIAIRKKREKLSNRKIKLAVKWARIISLVPTVRMVGLTGALAMKNAQSDSDIDLIIICQKHLLWTTRLIVVLLLDLLGIPRNAQGRIEKDHLCLNMWLDESDLVWQKDDRNHYTAHEIAQIVTIIDKNRTFEKFLQKNSWVKDYWPKAVKVLKGRDKKVLQAKSDNHSISQYLYIVISSFFEPIAFKFQYLYMRRKITRELVIPTRAVFHPRDWGKIVNQNLGQELNT